MSVRLVPESECGDRAALSGCSHLRARIETIVPAEHDPHAWIDALAVPEDRRPDPSASTWTLIRYLAKRWWARVKPWGRWTVVRDTGVTVYEQHRNGKRRASQRGGGYQPIDRWWVAGGDWSPKPTPGAISGVPARRAPSSPSVDEARMIAHATIAARLVRGQLSSDRAETLLGEDCTTTERMMDEAKRQCTLGHVVPAWPRFSVSLSHPESAS